jgi:hypothetical protein
MALCSDGITRSANIGPDGSYRLDNLPTGEVKLAVVSPEPPEAAANERRGERNAPAEVAPVPAFDRSKWIKIPKEYGDPRLSGLATAVSAGDSTFNLQLR